MCGFLIIAGTDDAHPVPHDAPELDRLRDVLRHRGPDAGETWVDAGRRIALMHRRLKVIDLEHARQPMASVDGRYHLVYNGEIYNYRELRKELSGLGYAFRTAGDTEVLLAAFQIWGSGCLDRLNGIFAFGIWDARRRRLFLARDPLGVKPLYYGSWGGLLYVASEAKAIVADPRVPRRIDPEALDLYFHHGYVPSPWAIWRGMRKLPAAHCVELATSPGVAPGETGTRRYWKVPIDGESEEPPDEQTLLNRLDRTLRDAVLRQTVSDVPLGAFLSGGVDSSLVVSYLAEASRIPIQTFSVGYADPRFDEREHAAQVARRFATVHHEIELAADSLEGVEELAGSYDEPFADAAALPTAVVSALAREHVTVVLSGDGGDETHAGYPRYLDAQRMRWLDAVPLGMRRALFGPLGRQFPSTKRRGLFEQLARDAADRNDALTSEVPRDHRRHVYSQAMREMLDAIPDDNTGGGAPRWRRELQNEPGTNACPLDRLQYLDLNSYLPEQLMVKLDRASMRVGLEARVPLLDLHAIELAGRIPGAWRVRDGRPKYLLRKLLARRMGEAFANRRKHGFRVPEVEWFGGIGRETLTRKLFPDGIERWLDRGRLSRFLFDQPRGLKFVWPFMAFAAWYRCYGDRG